MMYYTATVAVSDLDKFQIGPQVVLNKLVLKLIEYHTLVIFFSNDSYEIGL